jgi:hypothetical protein
VRRRAGTAQGSSPTETEKLYNAVMQVFDLRALDELAL